MRWDRHLPRGQRLRPSGGCADNAAMPSTSRAVIDTPLGPLSVWLHEDGILRVEWGKLTGATKGSTPGASRTSALRSAGTVARTGTGRGMSAASRAGKHASLPPRLLDRLARAAVGADAEFDDIATPNGTAFQRRCWNVARRIPRGATLSYGEVAKRAGAPGAARAVGQAMRRNPIALIVPCHRVVASNGLGGYAGTSRAADARCRTKLALLERERVVAARR